MRERGPCLRSMRCCLLVRLGACEPQDRTLPCCSNCCVVPDCPDLTLLLRRVPQHQRQVDPFALADRDAAAVRHCVHLVNASYATPMMADL